MPRLRVFAGLATALLLTACSSWGGPTYDPDKGLILGSSESSSTQGAVSDDGEGITLGKLLLIDFK